MSQVLKGKFRTLSTSKRKHFNSFRTIVFVDGSADQNFVYDQIGTGCVIRSKGGTLVDFRPRTWYGHAAKSKLTKLNQYCELLSLEDGIRFTQETARTKGLKGPWLFLTDSRTSVQKIEGLISAHPAKEPKDPFKTLYRQIIALLNQMPGETELRWVGSGYNWPSHWLASAGRYSGVDQEIVEEAMVNFYHSLYTDTFLFGEDVEKEGLKAVAAAHAGDATNAGDATHAGDDVPSVSSIITKVPKKVLLLPES